MRASPYLAVALLAGVALAGCLDVGKPTETKSPSTTAADAAVPSVANATSFRLDCYKQGGHTAGLPASAVQTNDTSLAERQGARALVCYTDHAHQDLGLRWTNRTTATDVLRIGADGVATWLGDDGDFHTVDATQYVVESAPAGGHVKVDQRTASIETGDVWSFEQTTVAKVGTSFSTTAITFYVPAGYDTSP